MKRALMTLALVALLAAALVGPTPVAATCTCLQLMTSCDNECASELCVARFICNTSNPCASTCTCIRCRP